MPRRPSEDDRSRVADAAARALEALLSLQRADGHWCGELQGDSILCSEYLLMKFILGHERQPMYSGADGWATMHKIANGLRRQQREEGTWGQYPGAKIDVSATVKAYFALKLMGDDPDAEHMRRASKTILESGGAECINSFSNFYLACLGQVSWRAIPAIPPEIVWLPHWFYFNLDNVSAWTRTMILPLAIVTALRPTRRLPRERGVDELFRSERDRHRLTFLHRPEQARDGLVSWTTVFRVIDASLKTAQAMGLPLGRRFALRDAERWILARAGQDGEWWHGHSARASSSHGQDVRPTGGTDGLGAIFPPMVYQQIAFAALGYPRNHPVIRRAERDLDEFFIEEEDHIRIQPCFSPVWDSGIALYALTDCGLTVRDEPIARASQWLRAKQCDHMGDWVRNLRPEDRQKYTEARSAERSDKDRDRTALTPTLSQREREPTPAGWFFEYNNAWYPDVDDTAMVAMALRRAGGQDNRAASERGVAWIFDMQNDDGGWAAFDRTRHRPILEKIPFADHNAMQDPSCPDITGRVLECLSWHGYTIEDPRIQRAIEYIEREQVVLEIDELRRRHEGTEARRHEGTDREANFRHSVPSCLRASVPSAGCWFGRWGVNYVYGTWQAVIGPIRCGVPREAHWIERTAAWIKSIQKDDGSFGESADSYDNPQLKGRGPSTASQTAWAAMILLEICGRDDPHLERAIDWLINTQLTAEEAADASHNVDHDPPGSWRELEFTGTGFPRVFYLRYHLYRLYFPLMALARYARAHGIELREEVETRRATEGRGDEIGVEMNARERQLVGR